MSGLSAAERETIISTSDADELVRLWTAQRRHITRLRRDPAYTEVRAGRTEGTEWAEFTTPSDRWTPTGVRRKRHVSASRGAELSGRMRNCQAGEATS